MTETSQTVTDLSRALEVNARLQKMSPDQLNKSVKAIGEGLAELLMRHEIPVPSKRFRPDVGHVQIDAIVVKIKVSRPELKVRLQFEAEQNMGVTFDVNVVDFLKDPKGETEMLFRHLNPLRRNIMRRRRDAAARSRQLYAAMTQGASNA